mmetsp:Transcript_88142/g.122304  ORF Transcript_88142/g.122304 Transcript_88142/m.122304 type:complete len:117 (+) Transcript_88142:2-352(+)
MAAAAPGIEKLLAAEKNAAEMVKAARNRKQKRLKEARDEAEKEVANFKAELEREAALQASQNTTGASADLAEIEKDTALQIEQLNKLAQINSDEVITTLLKIVTKVDIKTHPNFKK